MSKFKIGDFVKCINADPPQWYTKGKIYEVKKYKEDINILLNNEEIGCLFFQEDFELVTELTNSGEIDKMRNLVSLSEINNFLDKNNKDKLSEQDIETLFENEQKEFDATRLGYYRMRDGDIVKIIHKKNKKFLQPMLGIRLKDESVASVWKENGKFRHSSEEDEWDLIEYLGPELPKEPRKFEFEAYIREYEENMIPKREGPQSFSFNELFEKEIGGPFTAYGIKNLNPRMENFKTSKWKFIMQEILDDTN